MKQIVFYLLPISFLMILGSCTRKIEDAGTSGREYIPTVIGKYIIYDVDSMFWNTFSKTYTVKKSEMKFEFTDSFTAGSGDLVYVLSISKKDSGESFFKPNIVDHITISDNKILHSSKNLTYISLVFPVTSSTYWDGLAMIDRDKNVYPEFYSNNWLYEYANISKSFKSGSKTFNKTITVNHIDYALNDPEIDNPSFAEKILSKEVYAEGVGMVFKEFIYWEYQQNLAYRSGHGARFTYKSNN